MAGEILYHVQYYGGETIEVTLATSTGSFESERRDSDGDDACRELSDDSRMG